MYEGSGVTLVLVCVPCHGAVCMRPPPPPDLCSHDKYRVSKDLLNELQHVLGQDKAPADTVAKASLRAGACYGCACGCGMPCGVLHSAANSLAERGAMVPLRSRRGGGGNLHVA